MQAAAVSVKVSFKEDLRRLPGSTLSNYASAWIVYKSPFLIIHETTTALRQKISDLYGTALPEGFVIKYQDEEKDLISVTSDLELQEVQECLSLATKSCFVVCVLNIVPPIGCTRSFKTTK